MEIKSGWIETCGRPKGAHPNEVRVRSWVKEMATGHMVKPFTNSLKDMKTTLAKFAVMDACQPPTRPRRRRVKWLSFSSINANEQFPNKLAPASLVP